ncbi:MAG: PAS domain S-box protein [Nitrospinae bacterium]|nr:PAS domain S-box protein [Nitrospinota bacterium]
MNEERPEPRQIPPGAELPSRANLIYRNVLDTVASGVMSLDTRGVITIFNPAAAEMLGLAVESVVGRTFADVFAQNEDMEQFNDVIFDAVYDSSLVHQCVVEAGFRGGKRPLSLATRYMTEQRGGETVRIGIVAVFTDITELKELREAELRLAREVEEEHAELQEAYRHLEEANFRLNTASKRIRTVRAVAAVAALVVFVSVGLYFWKTGPVGAVSGPVAVGPAKFVTRVVEPGPISSKVSMTGRIAPRREVEVTSPITGKVAEVLVQPGERVVEGQRLVEMDVAQLKIDHRNARVAYIRARDRVDEIAGWSDNVEVSRARRAVSRSRTQLEVRKNRFSETAFLLKRGIIPASEHEAARREHDNQLLDLEAAEQALSAVLARGAEEREVAELEFDNARARLERVERTLRGAEVTSPAAGVVMHPKRTRGERGRPHRENARLAKGASVEQGGHLLTIGDLDGLTVVGYVDEVDVARIRPGQLSRITGDAFPGVALDGEVVRVSSEAVARGDQRGLPSFEVEAAVERLTEKQRDMLRLGMSARIEVVVYEKTDALLVPIEAVDISGKGPRLLIRDRDSGEFRRVEVVAGMTTLDSVEIVRGISAGDVILVARR